MVQILFKIKTKKKANDIYRMYVLPIKKGFTAEVH